MVAAVKKLCRGSSGKKEYISTELTEFNFGRISVIAFLAELTMHLTHTTKM